MIYRTAMRPEPVDAINTIDSFRYDTDQEYNSEDRSGSGNQRNQQSKERQLQNQIYMENSVLLDLGQNINMFA